MPAPKKVTREDILEGALNTLRESGFASVNARSVAKKLGCSTQPIYLSFKNMDELKNELTKRAIQEHSSRVKESMKEQNIQWSRYCSYGMGLVRFAKEEKQLFRFLYLEEGENGKQQDDIHIPQIIRVIQEDYGYSEEIACQFHRDMTFYSFGIAVMVNKGSLEISIDDLAAAFHREFLALTSVYGIPPKQVNVK
ncbi:MAG: TetR/AcrR family transcriptional regulator [Clostridiales bacterium]|nr:TetR/AcrR family transcriptional regulator [Clostridiales bacterium]